MVNVFLDYIIDTIKARIKFLIGIATVVATMIGFKINPADILSKVQEYADVNKLQQTIQALDIKSIQDTFSSLMNNLTNTPQK